MIPCIGLIKFNQLENYFGSLENAWKAGAGELRHAALDRKSVKAITNGAPGFPRNWRWIGWSAIFLKKLGAEPIHIDEICRASGLPVLLSAVLWR